MTVAAWLILTLVLAVMAWTAIWARRPTRARELAIGILFPAVVIAALAVMSGLGKAVPYIAGLTVPSGRHVVLCFKLDEGRAIYVLFDGDPPVYIRLPWSLGAAQALQDAAEKARRGNPLGHAEANVPPFDASLDRQPPQFLPPQHRADAPKQRQNTPIVIP